MNCEYEIADGVLIISEGVTVIEIGAFEERTDFTSVVFPDSLKEIGARAFAATALETVTIPGGIIDLEECVFAECESLKSVVLEEGLISVGEAAFENCSQLEMVVLPTTMRFIWEAAFEGCSKLSNINLPLLKYIDGHAFDGCRSLPGDFAAALSPFTELSTDAVFFWCIKMDREDGLIVVRDLIQGYCGSSHHLELPDGLKLTGSCFYNNPMIETLKIPASYTVIPHSVCWRCRNLREVEIPSPKELQWECFCECDNLEKVTIPDIRNIGAAAFKGCFNLADADGFVKVNEILFDYVGKKRKVSLPEEITRVSGRCFENSCTVDEAFGASIEVIEPMAFAYACVEAVTFPSASEIHKDAFYECMDLRKVELPEHNMELLHTEAFSHCVGLFEDEHAELVTAPASIRRLRKHYQLNKEEE